MHQASRRPEADSQIVVKLVSSAQAGRQWVRLQLIVFILARQPVGYAIVKQAAEGASH